MSEQPLVGIVMGSDSDYRVMAHAAEALRELGVPYEIDVVSAHRTPDRMADYAKSAVERGLRVIVAGAGGAAHLPGMLASHTELPVIGVPIHVTPAVGLDALLSIVQMPAGVPVATVSIEGGRNAGLLAARMLGAADPVLRKRIREFRQELAESCDERSRRVRELDAEARDKASR